MRICGFCQGMSSRMFLTICEKIDQGNMHSLAKCKICLEILESKHSFIARTNSHDVQPCNGPGSLMGIKPQPYSRQVSAILVPVPQISQSHHSIHTFCDTASKHDYRTDGLVLSSCRFQDLSILKYGLPGGLLLLEENPPKYPRPNPWGSSVGSSEAENDGCHGTREAPPSVHR